MNPPNLTSFEAGIATHRQSVVTEGSYDYEDDKVVDFHDKQSPLSSGSETVTTVSLPARTSTMSFRSLEPSIVSTTVKSTGAGVTMSLPKSTTVRDYVSSRRDSVVNSVGRTTSSPVPRQRPLATTLKEKSSRFTDTTSTKLPAGSVLKTTVKNGNAKGKAKSKNGQAQSTLSRTSEDNSEGNKTAHSLPLVMNSLADLDNPDDLNIELRPGKDYLAATPI